MAGAVALSLAALGSAPWALAGANPDQDGPRNGGGPAAGATPRTAEWALEYEVAEADEDYNTLVDVSASSADNAWAVGHRSFEADVAVAVRRDGVEWREVQMPEGTPALHSVATTSPDHVWATTSGAVLRWDGDSWETRAMPGSRGGRLAGLADDDVWHVANTSSDGVIAEHWDGTRWSAVPFPADETGYVTDISARASDDVWAVGTQGEFPGEPYAAHWDGTAWTEMSLPQPTIPPDTDPDNAQAVLDGVVAVSATDVWAVGTAPGTPEAGYQPLTYRFDGNAWKAVESPDPQQYPSTVDVDADGVVWASSDSSGFTWRWTGSSWRESNVGADGVAIEDMQAVAGRTWAVGGTLHDWDGWGVIYSR
ncbi:MAG: hypothetical protein ACRDT1_00315 [Micromonosporaceae bacterium]